MIVYYPEYFKKFSCVADKCPDTCCSMWQVVVDKKSATYYKSINNDISKEICSLMYKDKDGDIVFENRDNHCPFLNNKKLCDIHSSLGQEHTPYTCRMFPRFKTSFGGTEEWGISLSCPVAAQLITENNSSLLINEFNDDLPDFNDLDADLFLSVKSARQKCISYINSKELSYNVLNTVVAYGKAIQRYVDTEEYERIDELEIEDFEGVKLINFDVKKLFRNFEYLTEKGRELFEDYNSGIEIKFTEQHKNILLYYIYRYMLKAVYDYNIYSAMAFAVLSTIVISNVTETTDNELVDTARIYSKEIEHSQDNLNLLLEYLEN